MSNDRAGALEQLSAFIAEIEAEAYARGQADARKELLELLGAGGGPKAPARARRGRQQKAAPPKPRAGGRKRAPRGSVPRLVERALHGRPGLTPPEILDLAATEEERSIKLSSIRVELGSGRKRGRYESSEGRWSLAAPAPAAAEEDASPRPDDEPARDTAPGASTGDPQITDAGSPESEAATDQDRGKLGLAW
ncbi:MAG: hypothetical protein OXC28_20725 [Defluviicoccus sp.]|nr:hypothetical protein [Defluviicoccus sp.]